MQAMLYKIFCPPRFVWLSMAQGDTRWGRRPAIRRSSPVSLMRWQADAGSLIRKGRPEKEWRTLNGELKEGMVELKLFVPVPSPVQRQRGFLGGLV